MRFETTFFQSVSQSWTFEFERRGQYYGNLIIGWTLRTLTDLRGFQFIM